MLITKADGTQEEFQEEKLHASLSRAGADAAMIGEIVAHVAQELKPGAHTRDIYRHAFELLKKHRRGAASLYSMRRAIYDLGPSGFPFEQYVAELLRGTGYQVETNQMLRGVCSEHEIDVLASKDGTLAVIEAKFHNEPGLKSDLKTALYVESRIRDLRSSAEIKKHTAYEGWLITNTKFTKAAISFGSCAGLTLIGWGYPKEGNLLHLVQRSALYPVTALTSLSLATKRKLLAEGVVLCRDLNSAGERFAKAGFNAKELSQGIEESRLLCGGV